MDSPTNMMLLLLQCVYVRLFILIKAFVECSRYHTNIMKYLPYACSRIVASGRADAPGKNDPSHFLFEGKRYPLNFILKIVAIIIPPNI